MLPCWPLYYFFIDLIKEHLIANNDVNDSYLKTLLRNHAPSVIQNARRTSTLKSYRTYFSKLERWTERFEEVKPLPAEDKYVGVYLLDLIKQGETFNVINMSWFAMKAYHKFCGYNICNSFFCLSIYEGVKRTLQCMPNKKSPITPRHLLSMYNLFKGGNPNLRDLRTLTICNLAYAGFLRFSEVSVLKRNDIDIQDAYMRLFLEQSKTDIYRSGHWTCISKLNSVLCSVKIIQKYIQKAKVLKEEVNICSRA